MPISLIQSSDHKRFTSSPCHLLYPDANLLVEVVCARLVGALQLVLVARQDAVERMTDEHELLVCPGAKRK